MIRVLIVDDSITARSLIRYILSSDPELEVVGEASTGTAGAALARKLRPDVITMDVDMPRMNGYEATREIMISNPTPIVIVTASRRALDVENSLAALQAGALTVIEKPEGPGSPQFSQRSQELLRTVKAMSDVKVVRRHRTPISGPRPSQPLLATRPARRGAVVALASSAGGPGALKAIFAALPADFPTPFLVVQHINLGFITTFTRWIGEATPLRVKVAEAGERLVAGTVYCAPDDRHLEVASGGYVALTDQPAVGGFRPSGTVLFQSVARVYASASVAVILTGMGNDGVEGLRQVHAAGGQIVAQDESTSVVYGMPGAAVAQQLVDRIEPLQNIPHVLMELAGHNLTA